MADMVKQQHLDADLFQFFVEQEVYLDLCQAIFTTSINRRGK